jgi:hypothetical protein
VDQSPRTPVETDPLFPSAALLSLSDPCGVQIALDHVPGPLRPFSATLGVPRPPDGKKHDTNASKWTVPTKGATSEDGTVVSVSVTDTNTDT